LAKSLIIMVSGATSQFFHHLHLIRGEQRMQKRWIIITLALVFLVILSLPSCTKKRISSEPATTTTAEEEARQRAEEEARQKALQEEDLREEGLSESERVAEERAEERFAAERTMFENEDIYFEFDSIRLTPQAQEILTQKANWLRENPNVKVIIEGHCDNRGTNEYNLALGEGRAQSARAFLVDLGIEPSRLETISYGEERPLDPGQTEEAWAKNRRGHFVIEE
jgi:peptidoglycan-associated lipoprotein